MISDDYILGFVEGEGCFNVTVAKYWDDKPRRGIRRRKNKRQL